MATLFLRLAYRSGRDVSSKTITRALKYDQLKGGHNPAQRHLYSSGLNLLRNTGFHRRGSSSAGSKRAFSGDVPKSSNGASIQSDSRDYDKSKSSDTEISFVGTGGLGSSQSHNSSAASSSTRQDPPPRGRLERLKAGWKKYGMVGVGAYVGIQLTTIGLLWAGLEFDVLHTGSLGFDVHTLLNRTAESLEVWTGNKDWADAVRQNPRAGTFVLAYTMAQFTEPLRLLILVRIVPPLHALLHRQKQKNAEGGSGDGASGGGGHGS